MVGMDMGKGSGGLPVLPPASTKAKLVGISMALFAAFGGYLYGYDTGYISGTKEMPYWLETFGEKNAKGEYILSTANDSLVTSILSAGTFIGALLAYPFGDILGRRWGVIASCAIFCIGVALQTASTTIPVFAVGRVFAGLGVGLTSCLVPMYQSECAPKWIRGAVVAAYQWAITIGLLIAAVVVNATKDRPDPSCYRIPIALQFIWAFILALGLYCLPESPKFLILKGREEEAKASLSRLLSLPADSEQVIREYDEVADSLEIERTRGSGSYADCFRSGKGRYRLRTLSGMAVQALQQLTGINFIIYYGTSFFKNSNIKNPFTITVIINVVNVVMTVPGIWAVDRVGRRSCLLFGAALMAICQFIVPILGITLPTSNLDAQRALIALVCIYIGGFASTWGPIAWVVTSEIYPLAIRAKAMSLSTASNWALNFAIGYMTPYLVDVGPGKAGLKSNVFWIWGAFCGICFVFTFFFIPETKGLSLEQVDDLYQNSSILGSNRYRQQLLSGEGLGSEEMKADEVRNDSFKDVDQANQVI
ncbi:general substrate transporter [Melampsora americana]|nr:general substrate transporter [Melampsora americana]